MTDLPPLEQVGDGPSVTTTYVVRIFDRMRGMREEGSPRPRATLAAAIDLAKGLAPWHTNNVAVVETAGGERVGSVEFGIWIGSGVGG